jgi:hypothetical protein
MNLIKVSVTWGVTDPARRSPYWFLGFLLSSRVGSCFPFDNPSL